MNLKNWGGPGSGPWKGSMDWVSVFNSPWGGGVGWTPFIAALGCLIPHANVTVMSNYNYLCIRHYITMIFYS